MGGTRTNAEELSHIRRLYRGGLNCAEIARKLSRSAGFIHSKVKGMELERDSETTEISSPSVTTESSKVTAAKIILRSAMTGEEKLKTLEAIL